MNCRICRTIMVLVFAASNLYHCPYCSSNVYLKANEVTSEKHVTGRDHSK